ncbi:methyltransferase family protein [Micromonospora robiginosa]|uniref:Isoprenylcysteine carboxylmethyltransferase family protein n=1 Tax=Micromonospora robiginosa TaxID=2749844 RepID=A0A7L6BAN7_9ACTN|nr:isoprenylcysteine carboxylmethyltransferase family protein [Micromonospora ferruginea]QLQ38935.1 isoprenylcysteine carboxylmethyltransferase family protein [Micromonospora ferruginea]
MTAARYLALAVPLAAVIVTGRHERDRNVRAAALLAFLAAMVGIAALNEVARSTAWYGFAPVRGTYRGMPIDLWIGWAALWGPLPVLLRRALPLPLALGLLLWLDAVAMPALHPLVRLGPHWLVGELLGLVAVALPAQMLGRFCADRRHLPARALLQVALFAAVLLWFLPSVAFEVGDGSWTRLTALPPSAAVLVAQVALLVATPALIAVREFVVRGGGTPYPWDPPGRLVTTGPYAYLANPMQLGGVALTLFLGVLTGSGTLLLTAGAAVAFSTAVAGPHERHDLHTRHGDSWHDYRRQVRTWWPRWRPYAPERPAVLWLDDDCGPCGATWRFLARRDPVGLIVRPAREHPGVLWRAGYAGGDGHEERGVAAVARALEHLHLGWALVGWTLRLPGVTWLAQLTTDAMIAPPHPVKPRGEPCPTPSSASSTGRSRQSVSTASPASRRGPSRPRPE